MDSLFCVVQIMTYDDFLKQKEYKDNQVGFEPIWLPDCLFDFQRYLVSWAIRMGRCSLFEDCGLGKTLQLLVWAENVIRKTNGKVLVITPLAVSKQTVREGVKFGVKVNHSRDGKLKKGINVTNYHQLHKFDPSDFDGVVLDESSIIKNSDGKTRVLLTKFMSSIPYRLLCTATPAPNDYMELGTSAEALGVMKRNQMLGMFFANDGDSTQKWTLKGHARSTFWRWVGTWARAIQKPSDLGFEDKKFVLPSLNLVHHRVKSIADKGLFPISAVSLSSQRVEKNKSLKSRCNKVVDLIGDTSIIWCHLNSEGDLLNKLIKDSVQISGSDKDQYKEEMLDAFSLGQIKTLITKPSIAGFGLNWQHCNNVVYFPSHSHEQYYQAIRRCWRFGQKREVTCNLVYSEAEGRIVSNMIRKEKQAIEMYHGIIQEMNQSIKLTTNKGNITIEVPTWLKGK